MPMPVYTANAWRKLQTAFSLKGKHNLQLDEVITPVVIVEDLSLQAEQANDRATMTVLCAGIAVTTGAAVFSNLTDTGTTLLLDRIFVSTSVSGSILTVTQTTIAPILPLAGSEVTKTWNDPTQPGVPPGAGFANEDVFNAGDDIFQSEVLDRQPFWIDCNQIVPPFNQIAVRHSIDAEALRATFYYRVVSNRD